MFINSHQSESPPFDMLAIDNEIAEPEGSDDDTVINIKYIRYNTTYVPIQV